MYHNLSVHLYSAQRLAIVNKDNLIHSMFVCSVTLEEKKTYITGVMIVIEWRLTDQTAAGSSSDTVLSMMTHK